MSAVRLLVVLLCGMAVAIPAPAAVAAPPVSSVAPSISGTPARTKRLTADPGTWTPAGATFTYQWQRDDGTGWTAIAGATSGSYTLNGGDVGAVVRVRVTARNVDGSTSADAPATATVASMPPVNAVMPVVSGTLKRASQLTVTSGTWTPTGVSLAYQWQRDPGTGWADIPGATAARLTLTAADVGAAVRAKVTATNVDGSTVVTSVPTGAIQPAPPEVLTAPAVSGVATTGSNLTATSGAWTPAGPTIAYQWQRDDGTGWTNISGATSATYRLAQADVDARVRVQVTASNPDGTQTSVSAASATVIETPDNTDPPSITGTLMDTNTLTADPGDWTPAGATFTYRYEWLRCPATATAVTSACAVVSSTPTPTYTLVVADVTRPMAVRVVATQQGASGTATSALTSVVQGRPLTNSAKPTVELVNGVARVQEPLRATTGTWSVPTTSIAFQWQRCDATDATQCTDIPNAKSVAYTPVDADVGSTISVKATAVSPGRTLTVASDPTTAVAPLPAPSNSAVPEITGTAQRLQTVRVSSNGTWAPRPAGYAFQWLRCDATGASCTPIDGAVSSGYVLQSADVGSTVRASVTARNAAGSATAQSAPTAVVTGLAPANVSLPTINGTKQVGKAMSVALGTWTGARDTIYTYVWQRCSDTTLSDCATIDGANKATYVAASGDADKRVRVIVTGTNADGSATATSSVTPAVLPAAPVNSALPRLSGTPTVGETLTAQTGTWTNPVTTKQTRFYRCTSTCTAVGTLGQTSYVLTSADAGRRIRITETATGPGGTTTVWASTTLGPVASATTGAALMSAGTATTVRTATGTRVGVASASAGAEVRSAARRPAGTAVTFTRSRTAKGTWRAWLCAAPAPGADLPPCTTPVKLRAGKAVRLGAVAGRRVQVVVSRSRR